MEIHNDIHIIGGGVRKLCYIIECCIFYACW